MDEETETMHKILLNKCSTLSSIAENYSSIKNLLKNLKNTSHSTNKFSIYELKLKVREETNENIANIKRSLSSFLKKEKNLTLRPDDICIIKDKKYEENDLLIVTLPEELTQEEISKFLSSIYTIKYNSRLYTSTFSVRVEDSYKINIQKVIDIIIKYALEQGDILKQNRLKFSYHNDIWTFKLPKRIKFSPIVVEKLKSDLTRCISKN